MSIRKSLQQRRSVYGLKKESSIRLASFFMHVFSLLPIILQEKHDRIA